MTGSVCLLEISSSAISRLLPPFRLLFPSSLARKTRPTRYYSASSVCTRTRENECATGFDKITLVVESNRYRAPFSPLDHAWTFECSFAISINEIGPNTKGLPGSALGYTRLFRPGKIAAASCYGFAPPLPETALHGFTGEEIPDAKLDSRPGLSSIFPETFLRSWEAWRLGGSSDIFVILGRLQPIF